MRSTILACVLPLLIAGAQPSTAPTTQRAATLKSAATPGEAFERSVQAMVEADETAYRRCVDVKSPLGYVEGHTRWTFASGRLHEAVREHNVTGGNDNDNEKLSADIPGPPSGEEQEALRKAMRAIDWDVDGNVARPKGVPSMFGGGGEPEGWQGTTSVERLGEGWIVVVTDPVKAMPAEQLKQLGKRWSAMAAAIDAATAQVTAGKLKTIREVNDFVDGRE